MDEGIQWSSDTLDRQLALVTAKARDAVSAFLDPGYIARLVREMELTPQAPGRLTTDPAGLGP
jgi:hypothetical protein